MQMPVYISDQFVRFVTHRQKAKEIAGKVLHPRKGYTREAERFFHILSGLNAWRAFYRQEEA